MKISTFDPSDVVVNAAIAARRGAPEPSKIKWFADNFKSRRAAGMDHMIMPGVARETDNGIVEVIVGNHRLAACIEANKGLAEGEDPYLFSAVVVDSGNESALLTAIQENEWRVAANALDRGAAMQTLADLGKTNADIASIYKCSDSLVGDLLGVAKLPKKVTKLYLDGTLTEEGLCAMARYGKDKELLEELLQNAEAEKTARLTALAAADNRANGTVVEEMDSEVMADESSTTPPSRSKPVVSDAVRNKKKAGGKAPSQKTTGGDVKRAAEKMKLKKRSAASPSRTVKELRVFLNAHFGPNVDDESIQDEAVLLAQKLEQWLDIDLQDGGLLKNWLKCCGGGKGDK